MLHLPHMPSDGSHLLVIKGVSKHDALATSTHSEHGASLLAPYHRTDILLLEQEDELLEICKGWITSVLCSKYCCMAFLTFFVKRRFLVHTVHPHPQLNRNHSMRRYQGFP
jgi:hypothetical protein